MPVPIFLISCKADLARRENALQSIAQLGGDPHVIEGVDAREGLGVFAAHRAFLGASFWGKDWIKPGAFGCFLSHRHAWEVMLQSGADHALIMEDDAELIAMPKRGTSDLTFVNDRFHAWTSFAKKTPNDTVEATLFALNQMCFRPSHHDLPRAPGADGYLLSRKGAKYLLRSSLRDKVKLGVDWYLLYQGVNTEGLKTKDFRGFPELRKAFEILGPSPADLRINCSDIICVRQSQKFPSSILHNRRVPISKLKAL